MIRLVIIGFAMREMECLWVIWDTSVCYGKSIRVLGERYDAWGL